jgi:hypothetical protein
MNESGIKSIILVDKALGFCRQLLISIMALFYFAGLAAFLDRTHEFPK